MQRRTFVKKSVAASIIAASPMAFFGLVNAAGATEGGDTTLPETTWFTTEGTTCVTSVAQYLCIPDQAHEFLDVKNDANGNPLFEKGILVAYCWRPVDGCFLTGANGEHLCISTSNVPRKCNLDPNSPTFDVACLDLPPAPQPPICPYLGLWA